MYCAVHNDYCVYDGKYHTDYASNDDNGTNGYATTITLMVHIVQCTIITTIMTMMITKITMMITIMITMMITMIITMMIPTHLLVHSKQNKLYLRLYIGTWTILGLCHV